MTGIDTVLDRVTRAVRGAAEAGKGQSSQQIAAFRDDEHVCTILAVDCDNTTQLLAVAHHLANGMDPTHVMLALDTWSTSTPISPLTGEPWADGEMEHAALHRDGVAKGWVSEALHVLVANAAGDIAACNLRYSRAADRSPVWGPEERFHTTEEGTETTGPLSNGLRRIMLAARTLRSRMDEVAPGAYERFMAGRSFEEQQARQDVAAVKAILYAPADWREHLPPTMGLVMAADVGSVRQTVFDERLKPWASQSWVETPDDDGPPAPPVPGVSR